MATKSGTMNVLSALLTKEGMAVILLAFTLGGASWQFHRMAVALEDSLKSDAVTRCRLTQVEKAVALLLDVSSEDHPDLVRFGPLLTDDKECKEAQ